jgi:hypothetical protein
MQCVTWLLLFAIAVFVMASLLRWFEQTAEAVDQREWNKVALLVAMPFSAWFYRSKVAAGRPTAVPHHEPVRGFGPLPEEKPAPAAVSPTPSASRLPGVTDEPPPGTPKEFLGMPVIPPKAARPARPPVDPEKLAKLKQKMREQGMLPDDEAPGA